MFVAIGGIHYFKHWLSHLCIQSQTQRAEVASAEYDTNLMWTLKCLHVCCAPSGSCSLCLTSSLWTYANRRTNWTYFFVNNCWSICAFLLCSFSCLLVGFHIWSIYTGTGTLQQLSVLPLMLTHISNDEMHWKYVSDIIILDHVFKVI